MKEKKISVLGDSVSTFHGITPDGCAYYGSWNRWETGVITPDDTWWMKVIHAVNGILGMNNSMAGSLVSGNALSSGTSKRRIMDLGTNGTPDMILVAMGANDWGFRVLPEEFETEYRRMIHEIKQAYPFAEIWCATLPEGKLADESEISFFNVDGCISKRIYSDIIRNIAKESHICVADLGAYQEEYTSVDGVHPDKNGMQILADLWIKEIMKGRENGKA